MASKVVVSLIDDVDGSEASETVAFGLDGVSYELDLSEENAAELRDMFSAWTQHARRVGKGKAKTGTSKKADRDFAAIRQWAGENGYEVSDRGRVPAAVIEAYDEAH